MTDRTRRMGIPDAHMKRALILVRDLRIEAIEERLDPRAVRIALIYALMTDNYASSKVLSMQQERELRRAAEEFFKIARPQP